MDIAGNAYFVTGGGSGLGAATAERLAAQGGKVTVFDLNADAAQEVAGRIGGVAFSGDVADPAAVETALDGAIAAHGPLRGVVLCAGIGRGGRVVGRDGALPLDQFEIVLRVNLTGTFNVLRLAAERMSKTEELPSGGRGAIVMTASLAAFDGQVGQAAYSASKGGVAAMTLPIAREFSRFGIRVMTIAPGLFHTPLMAGLSDDAIASITKDIQYPARLGKPDEFAQMAESILANDYLNGEVIRLDAGARLSPK